MPTKRRVKRPPLHMKIRVVLLRPMSQRDAERLINKAIRTGIVPDGIELAWMEWSKGTGKRYRAGEYFDDDAVEALTAFRAAFRKAGKKIAVVSE